MAKTKSKTTESKTIHSDLTVDPAKLSKAERRKAALDKWEGLNDRVKAMSEKRLAARDAVLALGKHDMRVTATSGNEYRLRDETVTTDQHKKVVDALCAQYGVTDAAKKKLYAETAGTSTKREIKAI